MDLIILHGWMQNRADWEQFATQAESIKGIRKVITLDLPGFGKEPLVSREWGIPEYAAWVEEKIKSLNEKNIILFGHSFGGRVSALIASKNPSWLRALILSGTPALYRPSLKTKIKTGVFKSLKKINTNSFANVFYSEELKDAKKKGMDKIFRKAVVFDQTNNIKNINVPTLIIWGENDNSVSLKIVTETNKLIKDSRLIVIKKGTHNVFVSNPYIFFGEVKNFVEKL